MGTGLGAEGFASDPLNRSHNGNIISKAKTLPYYAFDIASGFTPFICSVIDFEIIKREKPSLEDDVSRAPGTVILDFYCLMADKAIARQLKARRIHKKALCDTLIFKLQTTYWLWQGIHSEVYGKLYTVTDMKQAATEALEQYVALEKQEHYEIVSAIAGIYIVILEKYLLSQGETPRLMQKNNFRSPELIQSLKNFVTHKEPQVSCDPLTVKRVNRFYEVVNRNDEQVESFLKSALHPEKAFARWQPEAKDSIARYEKPSDADNSDKLEFAKTSLLNKARSILELFIDVRKAEVAHQINNEYETSEPKLIKPERQLKSSEMSLTRRFPIIVHDYKLTTIARHGATACGANERNNIDMSSSNNNRRLWTRVSM